MKLNKTILVFGGVIFLLSACFTCSILAACPKGNPIASEALSSLNKSIDSAQGQNRIKFLIQRGQFFRKVGYYKKALADFECAKALAENSSHSHLAILADHETGYLLFLSGDPKSAEKILRKAQKDAETQKLASLEASSANYLGTVLAAVEKTEEAYHIYQIARNKAKNAGDVGMEAVILKNIAHILADDDQSVAHLIVARELAGQVRGANEKMDILLGIGAEAWERDTEKGFRLAFEVFSVALALARDHGDLRRQSQSLGGLGKLYRHLGQMTDAQKATQSALILAQTIEAHDLMADWELQMGLLLKTAGTLNKATSAFRRAIYHITNLPKENIRAGNWKVNRSQQMLTHVHRELADLLLSMAALEPNKKKVQELLHEAQRVIEMSKLSELRDYFRDPCLAAKSRGIDTLAPDTAVLYPILLSNRLELLVKAGGILFRKTVEIQMEEFENQVLNFVRSLRKGLAFHDQARILYTVLIRPVVKILDEYRVNTIIYVPDRVLRLLPLAPLMDNDHFLLERYSLVTVPGLSLLDPEPMERYGNNVLLAGISKPGPVIYDLPESFWSMFSKPKITGKGKTVRKISLEHIDERQWGPEKAEPAYRERMNRIKEALALPGVEKEICQLSKKMQGKVLFNDTFRLDRFSNEMKTISYSILHIASHGYFGGRPEENFIMTFDRCLNMSRFEKLIRPIQLAEQPVELITLSACQTAEGDAKSPLGLAGIVLKSGARSAIGSLWPVSDQAAQMLFPQFYARLNEPGSKLSKAEALRSAQLSLLKKDDFNHPFYWSAFVLIGNWL